MTNIYPLGVLHKYCTFLCGIIVPTDCFRAQITVSFQFLIATTPLTNEQCMRMKHFHLSRYICPSYGYDPEVVKHELNS